MSDNTYQIRILRKNNQTFVNIDTAPVKDVYAMLYGAVDLVAMNTNQSVKDVLATLSNLDEFVKSQLQQP